MTTATRTSTRREWTDAEIKLLGTMTDLALGKKLKRSKRSVRNKRTVLGIPPHVPHAHAWTKTQLAMLGSKSDREVAEALGLTRLTVLLKRKELGIAPAHPEKAPTQTRT